MAERNPIKLLLNQASQTDVVVAPAFSITKVLTSAALVVTPLGTLLVKWLANAKLTSGEAVTLTVAVLGLLAILGAADVLARALSTSRSSYPANPVDIDPPMEASWIQPGPDKPVRVIAARTRGAGAEYLAITSDDKLTWIPQGQLESFNSI